MALGGNGEAERAYKSLQSARREIGWMNEIAAACRSFERASNPLRKKGIWPTSAI
jgi:hypothetical protein